MPDCGFVGISMTFMPSDAALSRMPKYVGLSIAITSPGFATARRLRLRASRAPQVTVISRGEKLLPISGERRQSDAAAPLPRAENRSARCARARGARCGAKSNLSAGWDTVPGLRIPRLTEYSSGCSQTPLVPPGSRSWLPSSAVFWEIQIVARESARKTEFAHRSRIAAALPDSRGSQATSTPVQPLTYLRVFAG